MVGAFLALLALILIIVGVLWLAVRRGKQWKAEARAVALELGGHGEGEREHGWTEDSQVFEWDEQDLHVLVAGGSKSVDVPGADAGAIVSRGVISLTFLRPLPSGPEDPALQQALAPLGGSSKRLVQMGEDALLVQCFDLKDFRPSARKALEIGRALMQGAKAKGGKA